MMIESDFKEIEPGMFHLHIARSRVGAFQTGRWLSRVSNLGHSFTPLPLEVFLTYMMASSELL